MTGPDLRTALDRLLGTDGEGGCGATGCGERTRPGVRIGVDLASIPRIGRLARRHGERWLADHFTGREREQLALVQRGRTATMAGRIAAKEAFTKVLGPTDRLVLPRDIEVLRGPGGAPEIHPHGSALREIRARGIARWSVSITHEGAWAIAIAAGLPARPHPPVHPDTPKNPGADMQQIADWIKAKNPTLAREIDPHEDLIEGRLIDSLDFLEFIYLLEELSGRSIDLQEVSVDDFRTLERISERFLEAATAAS